MNKQFLKDALLWGAGLWLFGYVLGILAFFIVPKSMIGWVITPIAVVVTLWVLIKKVKGTHLSYYIQIGLVWTLLAIILDYVMIVKAFNPEDGYYKTDVYLYYLLTLLLPIITGWRKTKTT